MKFLSITLVLCITVAAHGEPYVEFIIGHMTNGPIYNANVTLGYDIKIYQVKNTTYGGWSTWSLRDGTSGYPFIDIYTIGNKLSYDNFFIDYKHYCVHTVNSPKKPTVALPFPAQNMSIISVGCVFTLK